MRMLITQLEEYLTLRIVMMLANRSRFNSSINTTRHIHQLSPGLRSGDNGSAQREKFQSAVGSEVFSDNGNVTCWSCYLRQTLQITHSLCEKFNNKEPAPYRTTLTRRRISFINFALFCYSKFTLFRDFCRCALAQLHLSAPIFDVGSVCFLLYRVIMAEFNCNHGLLEKIYSGSELWTESSQRCVRSEKFKSEKAGKKSWFMKIFISSHSFRDCS